MFDYNQHLREAALTVTEGDSVQERAKVLNIIEALIEDDMSVEELVDAIGAGTVPVRYVPDDQK